MVTYNYSVNAEGPVSSIQSVIDLIAAELSSSPVIERDIEISIGSGSYAGFTIPDACLFPLFNTSYRLVIKSQGEYFPIIDFNYSGESQYVGIDIGSGNPNVTIRGLRVQYFAVGIRAGLNSHNPIVHNCIVNNNRNVGIFFEQAAQSQAVQNVIVNGDYGIVVRLCKSAALIHNTIFMNGAISTNTGKSVSCVWAELANDYGGGLSDSGKLHLIGNIAWNTTGRCLTLFAQDVEREGCIVSNYNDLVIGDPDQFIAVEDNAFYLGSQSSPRVYFTSLTQWKQLNKDLNSKSEDPKFISPVKIRRGKNSFAIDLNILPVSPVLGMCPSFAYDSASAAFWLPSYFDSSLVAKDILNKNRSQSGTAAGCNEKPSSSGFYGQDVFSNPLDNNLVKDCGIDPLSNILFKNIDLWFPKIQRGYFYSHEREYYLYSRKETRTLGELAATTFVLPAPISHNRPIQVSVGDDILDTTYYDVIGNKLVLYHKDTSIVNGDEEVQIKGDISNWNGTSFIYNSVLYRFKILEGSTKYYLPSSYVPVGPVVITDDRSYPTDSDYISNREFALKFDTDEQKSEIIFANDSNKIINSNFDYYDSNRNPLFWQSYLSTVQVGQAPHYAVAGQNIAIVPDQGYIKKVLPLSCLCDYTFSFHAMSFGSGTLNWHLDYYDSNYDTLGAPETGSLEPHSIWHRYSMVFSTGEADTRSIVPQLPYPCTDLGMYEPPTRAAYVGIKLSHSYNPAYTGDLHLDAIQYEVGKVPSLYHRKHYYNELTVEFESETSDHFIDTHMSMSPVRNLISDGFLYIPELPAEIYGGPAYPAITTLHEWRWPEGRRNILPWSRTKGKDKLRKRPYRRFNTIPQPKPEIISPVNFTAGPQDIELVPSQPTAVAGDQVGVGFSLRANDTQGNPYANAFMTVSVLDFNLRYPGLLSKRTYGLKEQLSTSVTAKTDNSGSVSLSWIPPDTEAAVYIGSVPAPSMISSLGERMAVIKTDYPVSLENYGNVLILNYLGQPMSLKGDLVKEIHTPVYGADSSTARVKYPISPGSITVIVDGKTLNQNQINLLDSDQFFVDYENATVTVKGRVANISIEYIPSYVFVSQVDPYKIMIYYDKVFGSYNNTITLSYDFSIKLRVILQDATNQTTLQREFDLVAQNYLAARSSVYNTTALEF